MRAGGYLHGHGHAVIQALLPYAQGDDLGGHQAWHQADHGDALARELGSQGVAEPRPLAGQVMASMARRVARAPRAAALRAGSLGFSARAGAVTLTGPRLGAAFESLVRYGKGRGELSATIDEDEAAAMLSAVTAEAIIRWGAGDRPAAWLQRALRDRVEVVLAGLTGTGG